MVYFIDYTPGDTPESIAARYAAREGKAIDPGTFRVKRRGRRVDAAFRLHGRDFGWVHVCRDPQTRKGYQIQQSWRVEDLLWRIPREVESCYSTEELFAV